MVLVYFHPKNCVNLKGKGRLINNDNTKQRPNENDYCGE